MLGSICSFLNTAPWVLLLVVLPVVGGLLTWLLWGRYVLQFIAMTVFSAANILLSLSVWRGGGVDVTFSAAGNGIEMHFLSAGLSGMIISFAAVMFLITGIYTVSYFKGSKRGGIYLLFYFISLGLVNGAVLSDNLGFLLFFWEGLLCTLFAILLIGNLGKPKTAVKAMAVCGTADLLLMLGIAITVKLAGETDISALSPVRSTGLGALGCVCMLLGAMGRAGSMPFHSWIPSAAEDAPPPFLAGFPGSLEKIAGIYLMVRIMRDIYDVQPGSGVSIFAMTIGAATLILGVAMALIQKDMKRLLAYHAISQVGYMILGIGTALPIGITGGLFHMINHVMYKSGLFITAGAIESRTGTTDLKRFSGLGKKMPVTMVCFIVLALSISGFPGLNGFFSKELIYDAAVESGVVYYFVALLGAVLTAVSFLKLGGAAFFGRERVPSGCGKVRETRAGILLAECVLAVGCIFFGVCNSLPLTGLVQKPLGLAESFAGWPHSELLVAVSCAALIAAALDHVYGKKRAGSALSAADHIHYAPVLKVCYMAAERGKLDPYNWLMAVMGLFGSACRGIEAGVSWVYDRGAPGLINGIGDLLRRFCTGSLARYLVIALLGIVGIGVVFLSVLL